MRARFAMFVLAAVLAAFTVNETYGSCCRQKKTTRCCPRSKKAGNCGKGSSSGCNKGSSDTSPKTATACGEGNGSNGSAKSTSCTKSSCTKSSCHEKKTTVRFHKLSRKDSGNEADQGQSKELRCRLCGSTMTFNRETMLCPLHYCSKHQMARPDGKCPMCKFENDRRKGKAKCVFCGRPAEALAEDSLATEKSRKADGANWENRELIRVCREHYCREHGLAMQKDKLDEFFCAKCQSEAKKEKMRQTKREREERAEKRRLAKLEREAKAEERRQAKLAREAKKAESEQQ